MLDHDEQTQLLSLLSKLEPGFYPIELFWEFARLMTVATIECIPLRLRDGSVEVLLTRRAADDKFWPNKLHIPGCVVRPTDNEDDALERICTKELRGTTVGKPVELVAYVRRLERGNEMTKMFWVEVTGDSKDGEFYNVDDLPADLLDVYPSHIQSAARALLDLHNS